MEMIRRRMHPLTAWSVRAHSSKLCLLHSPTHLKMQGQDPQAPIRSWAFFAPWTALLVQHEVRVKTKRVDDHSHRFQFDTICLSLQRNIVMNGRSKGELYALAEAVHLIAIALSVDPTAWKELLVYQCGCDPQLTPILECGHPLVPRFEFDCKHYPGEILIARTGLLFFEVLMSPHERSPAFHAVKRHINQIASSLNVSSISPVPIKIDLSLWNERQDVMVGFLEFVRKLRNYSLRREMRQSWSYIENVELDLTGPEVCSNVVQRTLLLIQDAPFVHISKLTLDPKHVTCSDQELRHLLAALTATYPKLTLRLGDILSGPLDRYDGLHGSDSGIDPMVNCLMDAIASTRSNIKYLNLGHMMARGPLGQYHRQAVWNSLFGTLLHPNSQCSIETLSLSSHRVLNVETDCTSIVQAARLFPRYKIPTRLVLGLTRADQAGIRAIISAFGANLVELCLYDRERPIPSETVGFLLKACPKLRSLELDNVTIDSMEVFYGLQSRCQISKLFLNNVVVKAKASVETFITHLGDTTSTAGRNLSELVLARDRPANNLADKLVLSYAHVQLVIQALKLNGRIHTLELDIDSAVSSSAADALRAYHGRPAAVRRAPLPLSSKHAFLSVVRDRLSDDVVREVFEMAADCLTRFVHVKTSSL